MDEFLQKKPITIYCERRLFYCTKKIPWWKKFQKLSRNTILWLRLRRDGINVLHLHAHRQKVLCALLAVRSRDLHRLAIFGRNAFRKLADLLFHSFMNDDPVRHEVADISTARTILVLQGVDVVQIFVARIMTVKHECAGNGVFMTPTDKFAEQFRLLLEIDLFRFALVFFLEAAKIERIMFSALRIDVVGKQKVMGKEMTFLGMVIHDADVFDMLAGWCHQRNNDCEQDIIECDDSVLAKFRTSCNTANLPSYCAGGTVPFLRHNTPKDNAIAELITDLCIKFDPTSVNIDKLENCNCPEIFGV